MNTQNQGGVPKFAAGQGGYSAWYVYKFTDDEIANQVQATIKHVCNGVTLATEEINVTAGTEYTANAITNRVGVVAPENLTVTVEAGTTEYVFEYTYDTTALPFTTAGKYNLFILRDTKKRVTYSSEDNKCHNDGTEVSGEDAAKFYFEGDNISGFTIKNVAAGNDKFLGGAVSNNAHLTISDANTDKFVLENNSGHLVFRNAASSNGYINDVNSNIGYWTDGRAATDGGSSFEFVEIPDAAVNVTYYYKDNTKLYTTTTGVVTDGNFTAPKVKFLNNVDQQIVDNDDNSKTVNVICENGDDLPFVPSETFDAATSWYLLDVHSNEGGSKYAVYADADNNLRVVNYGASSTYPAISKGEGHENEQWCFVGNVYDGFKVYNRVVGGSLSWYQPSDGNVEITMSADGQGFRLGNTNGQVADGFTLKINGRNNYANQQGTKIQGWTDNDGGSSFRVFEVTKTLTVADDVINYLSVINDNCQFPTEQSENVTWPSEYSNAGIADFDLLTKAQKAVTDNDETALADYSAKLKTLIGLSNEHGYPISYLLTFPANEYGTAYLPFNTAKPAGLTLYTCEAVDGDKLTLLPAGDFKANTAVIIQAEESVRGTTRQFIGYGNQRSDTQANANSLLKGTHGGCVAPEGSYVLQKQNDVLGFYLVDGSITVNVPAGRCYLEWPEGETQGVSRLVFPDGTTTGIDAIFGTETENATIYDLSGRRVKNATKGIYIIGGKKVVVK